MIKRIRYSQQYFLSWALITVVATGVFGLCSPKTHYNQSKSPGMLLTSDKLFSLKNATAWVNSPPLTEEQLNGKVVLIQFCTYTCINWLRTLPYIRAWADRYKEKGLVIIGVHTPEFSFEENISKVHQALAGRNIDFPIAIDNKQDIWDAFSNQYWPAIYLFDSKGRIRYHQFGEGKYEQSEKVIQQLLMEAGVKDLDPAISELHSSGVEVAADWNNLRSAENYLGYERTENLANKVIRHDKPQIYTPPSNLLLNQWALSGNWKLQKESILLNQANGKIVYRFHARDIHLVAGASGTITSVRFRVLINGTAPGDAHGEDIDEQGNGTITDHRLYQLIRQPESVADCVIEIEFFDEGIEAFSFTFG